VVCDVSRDTSHSVAEETVISKSCGDRGIPALSGSGWLALSALVVLGDTQDGFAEPALLGLRETAAEEIEGAGDVRVGGVCLCLADGRELDAGGAPVARDRGSPD
jgi:hypothetical protein